MQIHGVIYMDKYFKEYKISTDKSLLSIDIIYNFLSSTYWASERSKEVIKKSIENSICFGVYFGVEQIGFARVVSDYATFCWMGDVFIHENHRGHGLGRKLIQTILESEEFIDLKWVLATDDKHELYALFGFELVEGKYMCREP